jgi:tetratricopeptide (TPR) repeat protein
VLFIETIWVFVLAASYPCAQKGFPKGPTGAVPLYMAGLSVSIVSPSSFTRSSRELRAYHEWQPEPEHALEVQRVRAAVHLLEAESARGGRVDDSSFARKLAKSRYKLWRLTLKKTGIDKTRRTFESALAFADNRNSAAIWVEYAQVQIGVGAYPQALSILDRVVEEFPTYPQRGAVLQLRASVWFHLDKFDDCVNCYRSAVRRIDGVQRF